MVPKKPDGRGPRDVVDVEIEQLEKFAFRMQAEAARMLALLDYAKKDMKLSKLGVKNLPSFGHGIEQVAAFISAVTKATSEASMKQPLQPQFDKLRKKRG